MGRLAKLGIVLTALAGLMAAAAVVVPLTMAGRIWAEAVARVETATGARITAEGPVRLKLFPPRLLASSIEVANSAGVALAHLDRAKLELRWSDLLAGRPEARRVQLRHARLLLVAPHPPADIDIQRDGAISRIAASFEGGAVRADLRADGGAVVADSLTIVAGAIGASGSAQATLTGDPRLVATFERIERGTVLLGKGGVAAALASDGLLIERVFFQGANGQEASFFGLAVADHGVVRVEGGLEARAATSAGPVEGTARLAASVGGESSRIDITDLGVRGPGTRLAGSLRGVLAVEPRVQGDLLVDALDLDALSGDAAGVLAPLAFVPMAELRLRVGRLTWKGNAADGVVVDAVRQGNQLTLRELAVRNLAGAPLHAQGRFSMLGAGVNVETLAFRYASLDGTARGSVDLSGAAPRTRIDAALNRAVALDAIVPPLPPLPPEPMTRRAAAAAAAAPRLPSAPPGWSRERFALPTVPPMDADIRVTAPRVTWRGYRLDGAEMKARLADGAVILDSLTGQLYDGRFELQGQATVADGQPAFYGTASLGGGDLKAVLRDYAGVSDIAGSLDGTLQLAASGSSPAELVAGLKGTAQIRCRDGAISGFNLPGMSDRLKRLQRPTDLAEVFRLGTGGGRTPFSALEGGFRIERGVARTDNLRLVAKGGEIRTVGIINLAAWTVDIGNQFRLTEHPELPPFGLKLSGPMDSPRRIFDFQELQSQLVRRGKR